MKTPDWSGSSGDIWARRWRDTDRALAEVGQALDKAILAAAPEGSIRALDVGCGPGTTTLSLAAQRQDAEIIGVDLSRALIDVARDRAEGMENVQLVVDDAERAARQHGPFDLIFSRHGVMFFNDPRAAFATLRAACGPGAKLAFSCFRAWAANPWAAELASAAAGSPLPAPGRDPSGFAFADPGYVAELLASAGWASAAPEALDFDYDAGRRDEAFSFLAELGPAARILEDIDESARKAALERMREIIDAHEREGRIVFPAAAWIWSASAD